MTLGKVTMYQYGGLFHNRKRNIPTQCIPKLKIIDKGEVSEIPKMKNKTKTKTLSEVSHSKSEFLNRWKLLTIPWKEHTFRGL